MSDAPCIFCRRSEVPRTREHVLQDAFGASATLPSAVCGDCNSAFSAIDKYFVEAVNFHHLGTNARRIFKLGRARRADGTLVAARMAHGGLGEFLPQAYEAAPGEWKLLGHREDELRQMLAELAQPGQLLLTVRARPEGEGVPRLSITRSARCTYLVEGSDPIALESLRAELTSRGLVATAPSEMVAAEVVDPPPINYDLSLDFQPYGRAMAKVALNFVCYRLGTEVALRPEFDALRAFARSGTADSCFDFVVPAMLSEVKDSDALRALFTSAHHGLVLYRAPPGHERREAVFFVMGGRFLGKVHLHPKAGAPGGLPDGTWLVTRFDPQAGSVEDLVLPDDMRRAVIDPAAIGMQADFDFIWNRRAEEDE